MTAAAAEQKYQAWTLHNIERLPQFQRLSADQQEALRVVGEVLPFKTNQYVVEQLIDWDAGEKDPMFVLTFPQAGMLRPHHYSAMAAAVASGDRVAIDAQAEAIRRQLNPHPAGQLEHNVPELYGRPLAGMQHKYRETVLFFPSNGQTCHAYCTFCFRWPQFVGSADQKFASRGPQLLVEYLRRHPEVTDLLITGGDPMVMGAKNLAACLDPIVEARLPDLQTIRIGTKAISYWPYRFTADRDSDELLATLRRVTGAGLHLAVMAHVNHPRELSTPVAREAVELILATGAQVRTQSPLMRNINDGAATWTELWNEQVRLGAIPYYMFIARDTGAQHYFAVPLVRAWEIFRDAYSHVSGLARTVRGPSMSTDPGKVRVAGVAEVAGRPVLALEFLQGRNPGWVGRPFFAAYDRRATWLDELRPAFGETEFFFEREHRAMFAHEVAGGAAAG
jgi:KamA family protein